MACRKVEAVRDSSEYVVKKVDYDDVYGLLMPNPEDLNWYELEKIYADSGISKRAQQAITQQYNELFIWDEADRNEREILAPQVKVKFDCFTNLPEIIYPRFTPLVPEELVWSLDEYMLNVHLGMRLRACHCSMTDYQKFINKVREFCEDFDIREEDILLNPSNIGYHPVMGLRIIDYGLTTESDLIR